MCVTCMPYIGDEIEYICDVFASKYPIYVQVQETTVSERTFRLKVMFDIFLL